MLPRSRRAALFLGLAFLAGALLLPRGAAPRGVRPRTPREDRRASAEGLPSPAAPRARVNYLRDIRPLLAAHCYACHGPAAESAAEGSDLRLDRRAEVVRSVIVPGHADRSRLLARVTSPNPKRRMPPPGANRAPLSAAQIDLIRRWIDEGAPYEPHWAFAAPARPPLPERGKGNAWGYNPMDAFIASGHARQGLRPSPEADRVTLLRRLRFDLTGLPPSPSEVDAFVAESSAEPQAAYEKAVERLLASPHFGERLAVLWLDLVRYADTDGYAMDHHREVWMYRDFVIDAFNRNRPFDRFTAQQLAGDLLPGATREDCVGSGYNRLQMTSQEGCADPREYTHRYAADRVRNVGSVWLGVTLGCAECHDHKFDPLPARDFYRLAAFFADIREKGVGPLEFTRFPDAEQKARLADLDARVARAERELGDRELGLKEARARWEAEARQQGGGLPRAVAEALAVEPAQRDHDEEQALVKHFRTVAPELRPLSRSLGELERQRDALLKTIDTTLLSKSGPPRVVRVRPRGDWADDSGEVVEPGLPADLAGAAPPGRRLTRLDLARWLTGPDNPLVARVLVNRLWKLAFGRGLVATPDDFGSRGAPPTHPELLDWLAAEFVAGGWDVKHVLRLIVTSSTYRQSSADDAELLRRDPENRWLARQNRFRLDAEFVRDNALAVSGLLTTRVGGRSVKPYQPEGFWASRFAEAEKEYRPDAGADQYRRGLYTYWCRSYLHPMLQAFDAPSRQSCTADRGESCTPFQALVLLNDPTFAEAARVFAARVLLEGGPTTAGRLDRAFRLAQSRPVRPEEQSVLSRLLEKHRAEFRADPDAAAAVVAAGDSAVPPGVDVVELAAWTSVARVILNLHETVTRK
jgi:hypothetical protein